SGMLVFQTDPFSQFRADQCHQPPHSMPPIVDHNAGQQYPAFNRDHRLTVGGHRPFSDILPMPTYEPKLRHSIPTKQHTFNLSDIAAVALLDSLSQGGATKSQDTAAVAPGASSQVQQPRLLPHPACPGLDYPPGFSFTATDVSAPVITAAPRHTDTPHRVPSMFQQTPGSFDSFNAPATGMGVPLSNYRLTAVNSSEFKNPGTDPAVSETTKMPHIRPAHESLFSSGLFLGASAKLHPTLRTSSGIFSNVRGTDHSAFPQISLDHKGTNNSVPKPNPIDCRSSTTSSQSSDYSNDDTKTAG
ncbi:hypothetical protein EC988_008497, partial [Linderina pennispora]